MDSVYRSFFQDNIHSEHVLYLRLDNISGHSHSSTAQFISTAHHHVINHAAFVNHNNGGGFCPYFVFVFSEICFYSTPISIFCKLSIDQNFKNNWWIFNMFHDTRPRRLFLSTIKNKKSVVLSFFECRS